MNAKGKVFLKDACPEARKWARKFPTLAEAWDACENPQWMLWALNKLNIKDDRAYRLFACWCARYTPLGDGRVVWDLLTDERSRRAVEVAEAFAEGKATREELAAARAAAWDAAEDAAWDAAGDAAEDAAWAAEAAAEDAARAAAEDAAEAAAMDAQSKALRTFIANPFTEERMIMWCTCPKHRSRGRLRRWFAQFVGRG